MEDGSIQKRLNYNKSSAEDFIVISEFFYNRQLNIRKVGKSNFDCYDYCFNCIEFVLNFVLTPVLDQDITALYPNNISCAMFHQY